MDFLGKATPISINNGESKKYEKLLKAHGYVRHHTATKRGYVSRRTAGRIEEYTGKFGTGYTWSYPRWDSTGFCYVEYWLKEVM